MYIVYKKTPWHMPWHIRRGYLVAKGNRRGGPGGASRRTGTVSIRIGNMSVKQKKALHAGRHAGLGGGSEARELGRGRHDLPLGRVSKDTICGGARGCQSLFHMKICCDVCHSRTNEWVFRELGIFFNQVACFTTCSFNEFDIFQCFHANV